MKNYGHDEIKHLDRMRSPTRCAVRAKRQKSPKRVAIARLVQENYAQKGRATRVMEIMNLLSVSRTRANELVRDMAQKNEIHLLSTHEKGQAQQILPRNVLIPSLFFTGTLRHGRKFMAQFPDEALIEKLCELLIELQDRDTIDNKQIEECGRKYGIMAK